MRMFCNNRDCKEARIAETLKHLNEVATFSLNIKREISNQQELIQSDLTTIIDGLDQEIIDACCTMIVDRFKILQET